MGRFNPSCTCCGTSCLDWTGTPPATLQLTLPATCERAGTHVLTSDPAAYRSDCPTASALDDLTYTLCEGWKLQLGSGSAQDTLFINVAYSAANGNTYIIAAVCNELGGVGDVDAGNIWGELTSITSWDDLDGVSLPWLMRIEDTEGMADCTGTPPDDAVISFVP
jgi:hypothetical protein